MVKKSIIIGTVILSAVLMCAVFSAGCLEDDPIVGTWDTKSWIAGASSIITFNSDGTGVITAEIDGFPEGRVSNDILWEVKDGEYYISYDTSKKDMQKTNIKITGENKDKMTFDTVEYTKN